MKLSVARSAILSDDVTNKFVLYSGHERTDEIFLVKLKFDFFTIQSLCFSPSMSYLMNTDFGLIETIK